MTIEKRTELVRIKLQKQHDLKLITIMEVAERHNIPQQTVRAWSKSPGRLNSVKGDGLRFIIMDDKLAEAIASYKSRKLKKKGLIEAYITDAGRRRDYITSRPVNYKASFPKFNTKFFEI